MKLAIIGRWSFLLGIIISLLAGLGGQIPFLMTILLILGLIVGFLNITDEESMPFLVSVIALLIIGLAGLQLGKATPVIVAILQNFITFVSAAALIVAVKQVLNIAKRTK